MRTEYVETDSAETAKGICPWAAILVQCEGGYMAFESVADSLQWSAQV